MNFINNIKTLIKLVMILIVACFGSVLILKAAEKEQDTTVEIKKDQDFTPEQIEFFEKTIRPLLVKRCYECHGNEESEGGLKLDSRESILKGGDSGAAINLKSHLQSLLLESISYKPDAVVEMPPDGRLTKQEVASIRKWVKEGLPWPKSEKNNSVEESHAKDDLFSEEKKNFWSFQPIVNPEIPAVRNSDWTQNEIDHFVLSKLEQNEMQPVEPATRLELIRRATFDLTGLPPTPSEVEEFLNDESPEAYTKLIDRLLASEAYGIRWGRHWLDVARYADSNGMDENMSYGYAYRYRDYVIDSFNKDKPYDLFIREQLAGDLMPDPENEQVTIERQIATGYLAIGPKMLAEDDPVKMRMDIIDEQIDTTGKAVLGMTLGCARCHDHKFDPVSTADYYALAGIFKSTKTMKNYTVVADWFERPVETKARIKEYEEYVNTRDSLTNQINQLKNTTDQNWIQEERQKAGDYLLAASRQLASRKQFYNLTSQWNANETQPVENSITVYADAFNRGNVDVQNQQESPRVSVILTFKRGVSSAEYDLEVPEAGDYGIFLQYAAHSRRPLKLFVDNQLVKQEAADQVTGSWGADGQKWFFEKLVSLEKGSHTVKLECTELFPHVNQLRLVPIKSERKSHFVEMKTDHLSDLLLNQWIEYLQNSSKDKNSIFQAWFKLQDYLDTNANTAGDYPAEIGLKVEKSLNQLEEELADHYANQFQKAESAWAALKSVKGSEKVTELPDKEIELFRVVLYDGNGPFKIPEQVEMVYPEETVQKLAELRKSLKETNDNAPAALAMAMGVTENNVENMQICIRGNHINLGREVERGFVDIMSGDNDPEIGEKESGRLQLAEWITSPEHPLTSRVIANRIWRWHFGEGIVRTPDNFGTTGELPTHPELLDWLATRFVQDGWSMKKMHKLIMTSSTYQMSSRINHEYVEKDPENKLLWRMNRKRLEIEAIRDAIMAISGNMDPGMGGTLLKVPNDTYVTGTASKITVEYQSKKRSAYLPVIRSALNEMFQAFDFPDPSSMQGDRATTTIAPQALFMLNSPFMDEQTGVMADRLITDHPESTEERLKWAYQLVYGRAPEEQELSDMMEFVATLDQKLKEASPEETNREQKIWKSVCRVLLSSSEFIFLN